MPNTLPTRRDTLAASLSAAFAPNTAASHTGENTMYDAEIAQHAHDWDWLVGSWRVRHSRLKARLTGSTEWEEFDGACEMRTMMGGFGNVDDNVVEIPGGTYKAIAVRAFNRETRQWSIWWLDERYPATIEPPVRGGFRDGVGEFIGEDTLNGQPIKVRFRWTDIAAESARWEQAFSADGGASWEVNWRMQFTRVAP